MHVAEGRAHLTSEVGSVCLTKRGPTQNVWDEGVTRNPGEDGHMTIT